MMKSAALRRWAVPVALGATVIGVGVGATLVQAGGGDSLPPKTAAQLLTDVQNAQIGGLSGTVVTEADLGLPAAMLGGGGDSSLSSTLSGTKTMRVWYGGPDRIRAAVLGTIGESDFIRNGADVWTWTSEDNKATHSTLDPALADAPMWPPKAIAGDPLTPQTTAEQALAAISGTTEVSVDGTSEVAGRSAYELVLKPKDTTSTIGSVRLAVDGETSLPLRTQVFAAGGTTTPALEVAFARVTFEQPPAEHFTFTPPEGVTVTELGQHDMRASADDPVNAKAAEAVTFVGEGWTTVAEINTGDLAELFGDEAKNAPEGGAEAQKGVQTLLDSLPRVSGPWGSGRVFNSTLVNALITDDGRILVGAVTVDKLVEVAGR